MPYLGPFPIEKLWYILERSRYKAYLDITRYEVCPISLLELEEMPGDAVSKLPVCSR